MVKKSAPEKPAVKAPKAPKEPKETKVVATKSGKDWAKKYEAIMEAGEDSLTLHVKSVEAANAELATKVKGDMKLPVEQRQHHYRR